MASRFKVLMGRSALVAAVLLAAAPLAAQDNGAESAPPPAPSTAPAENIGPRELQNFSLDGTVTRRAEPNETAPASTTADREAAASAPPTITNERAAPNRTAASEPSRSQPEARASIDPLTTRPTLRQPSSPAASAAAAAAPAFTSPITTPSTPIEAAGGFSPLPWLAALLLLAAGAAIYFGRQRQGQRYAAAGVSEFVREPAGPAPAPRPAAQPASPQPLVRRPEPKPATAGAVPSGVVTSSLRAPSTPAGVVSTSLRPWLELELEPSQALVNDEHAAIAFDVTLYNSGSAPARDVAVEACLLNAGQQQDAQLTEFYTTPGDVRDKIPAVAPMARITLKSAVKLPRSAVTEYEVEGRKLFMPMVAINSRYRWSSGEGQSAASFLVGPAANDSDKLAPLRLDKGSRGWKGLAARRYEKGIRR